MEISIPKPGIAPATPAPKNVSVERHVERPRVDAAQAIQMALDGDLKSPSEGVSVNSLTLIDSQTIAQGGINFIAESLSFLLKEAVDAGYDVETYHRIMTSAQHLNTMATMLSLDTAVVQVLIQNVANEWEDYSQLAEAQHFDAQLEDDEEEDEIEDDDDADADDGALSTPGSHHDFADDDADPSIQPNDLSLDDRFFDTPAGIVCLNADVFAINHEVNVETAAHVVSYLRERIAAGNTADVVMFAPGYVEEAYQLFLQDDLQGRVRFKPAVVDVPNFDGWAEEALGVAFVAIDEINPTSDEGEFFRMPTLSRWPRIELAGSMLGEEDTEVERDDD